MKARVTAAALATALKEPVKLARGTSMGILSNVVLSLAGERLALYATDYESALRVEVPLERWEGTEDGELCLNAAALAKLAKVQPKGSTVELDGAADETASRCVLSRGSFRAELKGPVPSDFPEVAPWFRPKAGAPSWRLPGPTLAGALKRSSYCMSTDVSRKNLCGLQMTVGAGRDWPCALTLRVTDGHRGVRAAVSIPAQAHGGELDTLVNRDSVASLTRLLTGYGGNLALWASETGTVFALATGTALHARSIDGEFSGLDRVLRAPDPDPAVLDRKELMEVVKRLLATRESRHGKNIRMKLGFSGRMTFTSATEEVTASESLAALGQSDNPTLDGVGVDGGYLLDALAAIDDKEIALSYGGYVGCLWLLEAMEQPEGEQTIHLVMPMRQD